MCGPGELKSERAQERKSTETAESQDCMAAKMKGGKKKDANIMLILPENHSDSFYILSFVGKRGKW